jgi:hypothetical protein
MSNLQEKLKTDDAVMKCLDILVIRRPICITNKGQLDLVIRKGENNYFLSIDSVPLEKEVNDKLMDILFKPEVPKVDKGTQFYADKPLISKQLKELEPLIDNGTTYVNVGKVTHNGKDVTKEFFAKKKGRPTKVK